MALMKNQTCGSHDAWRTWQPLGTKPRSAYIHIPFCRHRCGYCNFTLVADRDYLVDRFLDAIEQEIGWLEERFELDTLFLGGGTPSHLSPANLSRLRAIVDSRFTLDPNAEVSAECNPNDLSKEKSHALADFGINRISLGVQSQNMEKLQRLERDHDREDIRSAVDQAQRFADSVSLDLIFAVDGESLTDWQQDLQAALALAPDHLSTYELTYEKGTQFWNRQSRGELSLADEDLRADMYLAAVDMIEQAGLEAYEISSFAQPGHLCRHNESYWTGQPFFAFGPGASRYVDGIRQTNHRSTTNYLRLIESGQSPVTFSEELSPEASARELLAIGLRRVVGVEEDAFFNLTQFRINDLLSDVKEFWLRHGLIEFRQGHWRLTFRGRMLCDQLAAEIVSGV
jgi:oxygen-independent coproporphyrinogen-3 oxidase